MVEISKNNHRSRLRKKYLDSGIKAFHDYEKLELLLSFCIPYKDTKPLAKSLMDKFGSLSKVFSSSYDNLKNIKGITERIFIFLKFVRDIGLQIKQDELLNLESISSPSDIVEYYRLYFIEKNDEEFCIAYLNSQNKILSLETPFKGTVNRVDVYIRTLIDEILKKGAKNIIILHNHPGGSIKPSVDDKYLTFRLSLALRNIETAILDHLIIGNNDYLSFMEEGLMADINNKIDRIEKDYF